MKNAGSYSQLVYYSKGWFEKTDTISDLKKIISKRSGLAESSVSTTIIIRVLNNAVFELMDIKDFGTFMLDFLSDIDPESMKFKIFNKIPYDFREAVISKYLSILSILKMSDDGKCLIKLDDIDPTVLKVKEFNK
ncbi:MAG: hypothetical protein ACOC33_04085 [bacterium]